ncbi:MAG: tRNA (adenosine(37)-N6)-dimethylallyltransferase MiaA [Candidatus Acidiferrales bacterium]
MTALPRLIVVLGPTASGKSALGIAIAKKLNGEILVCDSTQVYRRFDIGTGKVPPAEQHGIPHHLMDMVQPDAVFTAGEYRRRAIAALDDLRARGKTPVITAGTGLYLRALLEGLADSPERSEELRERMRAIVARRGPKRLHEILAKLDRESAARIEPADTQKIIRAIELRLLAGKTVGEIYRAGREPLEGYAIVKVGLAPKRPALYARIHERIDQMIAGGWIDEVRNLVESGVLESAKAFQFIGYSQWRDYLRGNLSQDAALEEIRKATRHFAKRQQTWFRREPNVHWIEGFGDDHAVEIDVLKFISN